MSCDILFCKNKFIRNRNNQYCDSHHYYRCRNYHHSHHRRRRRQYQHSHHHHYRCRNRPFSLY
jgi:hypothetical protein